MAAKKKVVKEKGTKEKKAKATTKLWEKYDSSGGELKRKNKTCPKCGPSFFMAQHKDRITCGKCNYTEFVGKGSKETESKEKEPKEAESKEEKKESKEKESKEESKE